MATRTRTRTRTRTGPQDFSAQASEFHKSRVAERRLEESRIGTTLSELYAGIAIETEDDPPTIGFSIHDGTYTIDYGIDELPSSDRALADVIEETVLSHLAAYREEHYCKFLGAGLSRALHQASPRLAATLWSKLDIVPMVLGIGIDVNEEEAKAMNERKWGVDEQADSLVWKCMMMFGPTRQPRTTIGFRNDVLVDQKGRSHLTTIEDYKNSVRDPTWRATMKYVEDIRDRKVKIAFFNATPQGGGVALMRHALLRFLHQLNVDVEWYVPRARADVFRITKTNHNILQGVVDSSTRSSDEDLEKIKTWVVDNAEPSWQRDGGPLAPRSRGGADIIVVDDPQMPELIPLAKRADPDRPVIFRCHIEVNDDLVGEEGSAAQHVWRNMWSSIKHADVFISHPVRDFVPDDVNMEAVGYMPATTDWLDGLNKHMEDVDIDYYLHELNVQCERLGIPQLAYPRRGYICQIARFDPAKGIPDVIKSFALFRLKLQEESFPYPPQLVVCGHSSVDDPDGSLIYDQTMKLIHDEFIDLKDDIIVARLGPSDQLLNAIISKATIVLQLSTREGFEVKVSEALHKGKPVIATLTGGIPLQVTSGSNGFLVPRGDIEAIATHLHDLWTDKELYNRMATYAAANVSDEVGTVGNALCWMYLASKLSKATGEGDVLKPKGRWINDLAREEAGEEYRQGEPRLPRGLST